MIKLQCGLRLIGGDSINQVFINNLVKLDKKTYPMKYNLLTAATLFGVSFTALLGACQTLEKEGGATTKHHIYHER